MSLTARAVATLAFALALPAFAQDPLPSWNDTAPKNAIEFAYNRQSHIGKLDKGLDEAKAKGWTVVSMKDDWKAIFPPPK